jgi:putative membrane protein
MGFIKPIVITFIAILVLAQVMPSISYLDGQTLIIASIILTLLQEVVKPVLNLLLLPFNIITFGLFSWVINVLILWLLTVIVPGFHIDPVVILGVHFNYFFSLLLTSFAISVIKGVVHIVF